jgi:hypothetical protein
MPLMIKFQLAVVLLTTSVALTCINRNNHQKPTFHPLGDFLNPALALLGQGLKKSPIGQKLDFANHPYLCKGLNQTLNLTAILGVFGKKGDEGGFARASLDYAIDDKISISEPSLIPVYSTPIKLSILDFVSVSPEYLMVSK